MEYSIICDVDGLYYMAIYHTITNIYGLYPIKNNLIFIFIILIIILLSIIPIILNINMSLS